MQKHKLQQELNKQNMNTKNTTRTAYYKDNKKERERMQIIFNVMQPTSMCGMAAWRCCCAGRCSGGEQPRIIAYKERKICK